MRTSRTVIFTTGLLLFLFCSGRFSGSQTELAAPSLIEPESKAVIDTTTPVFRWTPVPDAKFYAIYISRQPFGSDNLVYKNLKLGKSSFRIPAGYLKDGFTYRWNIRSGSNYSGWDGFSETNSFTVQLDRKKPEVIVPQPPEKPEIPESVTTETQAAQPEKKISGREWLARGDRDFAAGNYPLAVDNYTQALAFDKERTEAYNKRALAYAQAGQPEKAIADYTEILATDSEAISPLFNRGLLYSRLELPEKALSDFSAVIRLNPQHLEAWYNRGLVYGEKGNYLAAIPDFSRVINLKPDHGEAYYARGLAYYVLREYQAAYQDLRKARELGVMVKTEFLQAVRRNLRNQ